MDPENSTSSNLQAAILADSKFFLASLASGASEEQLIVILDRIKDRELRLMAEYGLKLSPEIWNILQSRLNNRKTVEIINTVANSPLSDRSY